MHWNCFSCWMRYLPDNIMLLKGGYGNDNKEKETVLDKLLSALLVASMLVGTAGTSSFAAGDPQQKTETGATVSDDSAGNNEDTAEKAAADTVEEDASASDGADTSASKAELPKESGEIRFQIRMARRQVRLR